MACVGVSIVIKATTIMICYSQLEKSSNTLHVQTILTAFHCYCYLTVKIMKHLFLSKKMTTFQDVKLSLAEVKTKYLILSYFMRMIDDKLYLLNSMTMNILNEPLDKSSNYYTSIPFAFHQIFDACQKGI
jgi:hypothetical protein